MSDHWERELDEVTGIAGAGWDVPDEVDGEFSVSSSMPLREARKLSLAGFTNKALAEVVRLNRTRSTKQRLAQELDAFAFTCGRDVLLVGEKLDRDGNVVKRGRAVHNPDVCLFAREGHEPCSREYDAMPYAEAALTNEHDYVGTGIGALYGLGGEQHLWTLAGWNVRA